MSGKYRKLDDKGETSPYDVGSYDLPAGNSRYSEDTPTFESLQAGNAGRGIQGVAGYSRSGSNNSKAQYLKEKKAGGAMTDSYASWKKL